MLLLKEKIKKLQKNWIGKSEGARAKFQIKQAAKKFVLIHGYTGTPEANFFPWLKNKLEQLGHGVSLPALPNTDEPNVQEQIDFVLKNETFDENTIVVAHSLGGSVVIKALESVNTKIQKLILVGGFVDPKFKDHPRPFESTFDWQYDFEKISNHKSKKSEKIRTNLK